MTEADGAAAHGPAWWQPARHAARRGHLACRARVMKGLRAWFDAAGFVEVETPALQVSPGMEPHLQAFATELRRPDGAAAMRYLHTSPEFAMKKLLVAGEPRIFQIAHAFRNAEGSDLHHPEFTMLEWYRADADYRDIMADCEALLAAVAAAAGVGQWRHGGRACAADAGCERLTVAEAFRRHAGIDLDPVWPAAGTTRPAPGALRALADRAGIRSDDGDEWDDLFFRIFLERVEPCLGIGRPTILHDYPAHMAALSRLKPDRPDIAERFELYICGLELANAFSELTDAAEQEARFLHDQAEKRRLYGDEVPIDSDFLAALAHGMPPAAGIALGVDRLAMLASGADSIDQVLWVPVASP